MFDLCPRGLQIKFGTDLGCVTSYAPGLHIADASITLSRILNVIAAGPMTLFALHVWQPSKVNVDCARVVRARRVAIQTTRFELENTRRERVRCLCVSAVGPLHILGNVTLAAGRA